MRVVALILLVACGEPTETGPYAAVGRVLDASGAPVAGQTLESVEGRDVTDAEGRFVVEWKPPSQHVDFARDGVWYSRSFREADVGGVLELRLPEAGPALLRCERAAPCDLQLVWDLGDGFVAKVKATCPPDEVVPLALVPKGTPVARCAPGPGRPEETAPLVDVGDGFVLQDAPQAVRVEIHAESGDEPSSCAVRASGRSAEPTGDGAFALEVSGRVAITARCDGRPATPKVVRVTQPVTVALDWSSMGPDLDLGPWLPGARTLVLEAQAISEGEGGWRIEVDAADDGLFHLPPLPRGTYRIGAGAHGPPVPLATPPEPGVVTLAPLVRDPDGAVVGVQGTLVVAEDATSGALRVAAPY